MLLPYLNPDLIEAGLDMRNGLKVINMKSKVYNFAENCRNVNYNIKYEISSHKTIAKIKKRNIIRI